MGLIWAKLEEERNELNQSRARATQHLQRFRPEYIEDDRLVGLAPGAEEPGDIEAPPLPEPERPTKGGGGGGGAPGLDGAQADQDDDFDPKSKARERMRLDHLKLLQGAAKGSRWTVIQLGRRPHVRIDYADAHGRTALYLACEHGHFGIVSSLLTFQAKTEKANNDGWTPLHAATFHGQLRCMEALMEVKANVNSQEKHGCTPLIFAASSPKLYLLDFVSKSDRQKRQKARVDAFRQGGASVNLGSRRERAASVEQVDPTAVWRYYPNKIELIVLNSLLSTPGIKVDMSDFRRKTPLIHAARFGHIHAVSRLLDAKASIRWADSDGRTAFFHAACNQHYDVMDLLLRAGSSVNVQDQFFRTPLHGALEAGDEGMANLLLKARASVQAYDCEGRTPIMMAMDQQNKRLFTAIVEHGSSLDVLDKRGWNVVIYAIEKGMLNDIMPLLYKLGDRVNRIIRAADPQGKNSVHHAAQLTPPRAAGEALNKLLKLDHEAAQLGDCNGNTAFHMVAELGRLESMQMLLENVTEADFLNNSGETPLHLAAHCGHLATVLTLIRDRGQGPACNPLAIDSSGWSLLMHACVSGHLDIVNLLLRNRAPRASASGSKPGGLELPPMDVNHLDKTGLSALSVAAREGHWHLLPSLVLAGANCAAKDRDGFTALHWAVAEDEALAASCLLDLGLDPNARDAKNWTPLMLAASRGCDDSIRALLDGGADADARNWDGDTALQLCVQRTKRESLQKVQTTKDILTDGILDLDCRPRCSVAADGHFMVSVLDANGLYLEGSVGEVNAYVCLQLRTEANAVPHVAFTSCTLQHPCPEWHEVFRFDTERLDPTACLVAWVIAAPGDSAEEVVEGSMRGLGEEELRRFKFEEMAAGRRAERVRPEFTTAIQQSFNRLTRRAEITEDMEVDKLRKLAMAQASGAEPTEDLVVLGPNQRDRISLEERRWNEVTNLRKLLERSGCRIDEPLVPRSHLPMGCVVVRFRNLRQAVWGTDPVEITRTLRLGCRGSLRMEVDFRPTFFMTKQKRQALSAKAQHEDPIYDVKPVDAQTEQLELEFDLKYPPPDVADLEERPMMSIEDRLALATGSRHKTSPEELFKHFMKVTVWSQTVLRARRKLAMGMGAGFNDAAGKAQSSPKRRRKKLDDDDDDEDDSSKGFLARTVKHYQQRYKASREQKEAQQRMMDKPIGAAATAPRPILKEATVQPKAELKQQAQQARAEQRLPKLHVEPWLDEMMEGSRLF